jgi:hypothetical protein
MKILQYPSKLNSDWYFVSAFQRRVLELLENLRRQVVVLTNAAAPNGPDNLAIFQERLPLETEEALFGLERRILDKEDVPAMVGVLLRCWSCA